MFMSMSDRRARESLSQALSIVEKGWNCWNAQFLERFNSFNAFQAVGSALFVPLGGYSGSYLFYFI